MQGPHITNGASTVDVAAAAAAAAAAVTLASRPIDSAYGEGERGGEAEEVGRGEGRGEAAVEGRAREGPGGEVEGGGERGGGRPMWEGRAVGRGGMVERDGRGAGAALVCFGQRREDERGGAEGVCAGGGGSRAVGER